jgi:hypothetical protein
MRQLGRWLEQMDRIELVACALLASVLLLASAAPLAFSFAVSPADIETGRVQLTPECPYRARHGAECMTCGMTRAFAATGHGRLQTAWRYNRGALPLYGALVTVAVVSGVGLSAVCRRLSLRRVTR